MKYRHLTYAHDSRAGYEWSLIRHGDRFLKLATTYFESSRQVGNNNFYHLFGKEVENRKNI